jgi:hypothetical protein
MWRETEITHVPFISVSDNSTIATSKAEIKNLKNVEFNPSKMYTEILTLPEKLVVK